MKVWDIVQPKDNWSRDYAYIEWLRVGLYQTFAHMIPVLDTNGCRYNPKTGNIEHDDYCSDLTDVLDEWLIQGAHND